MSISLVKTKNPGWIIWPVSLESWERTGDRPVAVTARGAGRSLRHELGDCRSSEMVCFWEPENTQRMETGGRQASLSCRSPWSLPTAPALSWHHSTLHMAAAPGRPEAASSAPLGGAKLSSNYRQPAPGQPQPVPSIPSEARSCGLKSATEAARRRSVGEACQLSHSALPRPFRRQ